MERPSKAASEEVVDKTERPIDDEFMEGPSKAASKMTRKGYKIGIGLWHILSWKELAEVLDEAADKILRNLSPVIDKIIVDQIIEGIRKKYPTDEDVVIDMIIEVLSQIFHEMMEAFRNNYFPMSLIGTSYPITTPLIELWRPTAITLLSISFLRGLQKTIWKEVAGKIVGGQLLECVFAVRKEVCSDILYQIWERLSHYVDKMRRVPSEEVPNKVVHKITEELRHILDNIMEGPHLKEALDKAVDGILKELESILKGGPSKEVSKVASITAQDILQITFKILYRCVTVSDEFTVILHKLVVLMVEEWRIKEASDELIDDLARLDRNLEGLSKKDSHCHRVIERCVALLVPECGDVRNCIEEIKLKEGEQKLREQKMKELINDVITKIEISQKESTDERDKIIKSITVRDSKSAKTVKYVDRRDKKASKKDGGKKK